jgi:AcrR family transcriptional regulator
MAATRPAPASGPTQTARTDRRHIRHQATKREILTTAWQMVRADGVAALSLSALARAVGMEPQSLYTYFASKHAVYDAMYAEANRELLARMQAVEWAGSALKLLRAQARVMVGFSAEDPARHQLVFERPIPDFEPSPESYAIAVEVVTTARALQAQAGLTDNAQFDLWTAVVAGLAAQQSANDPGGDRWIRLIDEAVDMYAHHVFKGHPLPEDGTA